MLCSLYCQTTAMGSGPEEICMLHNCRLLGFFFPYSEVGGWGVVWDYQIRYTYIPCKHSLLKELFMHVGEYGENTDVAFCKIKSLLFSSNIISVI